MVGLIWGDESVKCGAAGSGRFLSAQVVGGCSSMWSAARSQLAARIVRETICTDRSARDQAHRMAERKLYQISP